MRTTRRLVQLGFLVLTLAGVFVLRGHAERWCPFGGVEAIYTYWTEGNLTCSLGVSNFYILGGVLLATLLLRRAFCGYVCPIGAVSEWVQGAARRMGVRAWRVPPRLDRGLALLKYAVLGVILYFTWKAGELIFRGFDPCYALISRHGEDITVWAYVVAGGILAASTVLLVPFCRWLCPLAAVFTPFSRFGLTRVRRHEDACVDCGACTRACPMAIPVDKVREVTAARCTSCLECVAACPKTAGAMSWGPPHRLGRRWPQAALVVLLLACLGGAVAATYAFPLPSFVQSRGEPPARTASVKLTVSGVACRHGTMRFVEWLDRNDEYAVRGYLKVEAWPAPDGGVVRLTYDPSKVDEAGVKRAIVMPYFDLLEGTLRSSPYEIEGYRPGVGDL